MQKVFIEKVLNGLKNKSLRRLNVPTTKWEGTENG
jgi:hypothetical protein